LNCNYLVEFFHDGEVEASFSIEDCPSEVVALSQAMTLLYTEVSNNHWVKTEKRTIKISSI
jgi:hypothetical protein